MNKIFGIGILWIVIAFSSMAVTEVTMDTLVTINGQLKDMNNRPVFYAHIINSGLGIATTSDSLGFFRIHMRFRDSLHISAIGFTEKYFLLPHFWPSNHFAGVIYLKYKIYEIQEVSINSLGSYEQFKQKVLNTRVPPPPAEEARIYLQRIARQEAIRYDKVRVGFSFHMKSLEERSLEKLKIKLQEEERMMIIEKKFNVENVGELTGLKGQEVKVFMNYCRFPEDFLLYSSEYDILEAAKRIYIKYYKGNIK